MSENIYFASTRSDYLFYYSIERNHYSYIYIRGILIGWCVCARLRTWHWHWQLSTRLFSLSATYCAKIAKRQTKTNDCAGTHRKRTTYSPLDNRQPRGRERSNEAREQNTRREIASCDTNAINERRKKCKHFSHFYATSMCELNVTYILCEIRHIFASSPNRTVSSVINGESIYCRVKCDPPKRKLNPERVITERIRSIRFGLICSTRHANCLVTEAANEDVSAPGHAH